MGVIEKINSTLAKLGVDLILAKAPVASGETSGSTSGVTVTSAAAGVVVSEIIPKTIKISYSAIGAPVIQTNEDGKEENVTDGEYILTTNKKITVEGGKLTKEEDVEEIEVEEEKPSGTTEMAKVEVPVIELAKYPWDKCIADMTKEGYDAETAKKICGSIKAKGTTMESDEVLLSQEQLHELVMAANLERQRIADLIDLTKNGSYCINIEVVDGAITWGTMQTNTYQNLLLEKETEIDNKIDELTQAYEAKLSANEKVIEALKTGEVKTNIIPVASDDKTILSKSDFIKLDIQEKINKKKI